MCGIVLYLAVPYRVCRHAFTVTPHAQRFLVYSVHLQLPNVLELASVRVDFLPSDRDFAGDARPLGCGVV
jgi:hypothetical protein